MSEKSKIEWTDATWNPVTGCNKVSPGCKHCYAERDWENRLSKNPKTIYYGRSFTDVQTHSDRLAAPLRWQKPKMIFVNSMSDLFHDAVPDSFLDQVFAVMALCHALDRGHVFQVLTKRPARALEYLSVISRNPMSRLAEDIIGAAGEIAGQTGIPRDFGERLGRKTDPDNGGWPLPNVWLGTSVENQECADERIPLLIQTPAAVRFLSCEPLLEAICFRPRCDTVAEKLQAMASGDASRPAMLDRIDWVIVGGESGPGARPMRTEWVRGIHAQCVAARVPIFLKQWGEYAHWRQIAENIDGKWIEPEWFDADRTPGVWVGHDGKVYPEGHDRAVDYYYRVGKARAGRKLDGVTYDGMPEVMR